MHLNFPYHIIHSGTACQLITFFFLASCSSSDSPSSTEEPAAPATATPAPAATSSPTAEVATPSPTAESTTRNVHYADVDDRGNELDVYAPSEPGPWPVVVTVHGGGQSRRDMTLIAEAISSQGAVVYNIDVKFIFPELISIEGIACAVRFARATAADYGGDPGRITLVGNSAGATSASVVALAGDNFEGDCVVTDGSALPDVLVAFEGLYDHMTTVYRAPIPDHTVLKDEDPELWEAINPYSQIGRNPDLQVRLVHGVDVDDEWYDIPPEVSIEFYQALADAGYDVELFLVEGSSHLALGFPSSDAFELTVQQVMKVARNSSQ
jgi:acetyl esterase/lipase